MSRLGFLGAVIAFGSGAAVLGIGLLSSAQAQSASRIDFKPTAVATDATVHVPTGYSWHVVAKWRQPLFSGAPDLDHATGGTLAFSDRVFGENTDGMEHLAIGCRQIIVVNHEYVNPNLNLQQNVDGMVLSAGDVRKLQNLQGVTVMETTEGEGGWNIVVDSDLNRRITQNTPMKVAGHDLLKTNADPTGRTVLDTMNNCGAGKTPWGTYLTREENLNGY